MKQIVGFILVAVMLLVLMGCGSAGGTNIAVTGPTYTNHGPVQVHVTEITREEQGLRLEVEWKNNSNIEALFGEAYRIQRKEGKAWVDCARDGEPVFSAIAYILPPGGSRKEVYYPEFYFDLSKPGTYRFLSNCTLEEVDTMEVWAEFTLEEEANTSMSQTNELQVNPPALKLESVVAEMDVPYAGCTWYVLQEDGTMASVLADHADPLMMQNSIPHLTVSYSHLKLEFETAPDTWSVTCWPAEDWAEGDAESHFVQTSEDGFAVRPGKWLYAVCATWEDKGNGYYGTAEYYVYIETAAGNVNGLAR